MPAWCDKRKPCAKDFTCAPWRDTSQQSPIRKRQWKNWYLSLPGTLEQTNPSPELMGRWHRSQWTVVGRSIITSRTQPLLRAKHKLFPWRGIQAGTIEFRLHACDIEPHSKRMAMDQESSGTGK
jgi:hypothetical protein